VFYFHGFKSNCTQYIDLQADELKVVGIKTLIFYAARRM